MDFYKRVLILTGVENRNYSGVIKINTIENGVDVIYNINAPVDDYTLLLKENNKMYTATIPNGKGNVEIKGMKNDNVVLCNLLANDKILMYGATNGNKIAAFALNDEYKKKNNTLKKTPLKVSVKSNSTKNIGNTKTEKNENKSIKLENKNIKYFDSKKQKTENFKGKIKNITGVEIPTEEEILNDKNLDIKKNDVGKNEIKEETEQNENVKNFSDNNIIEELFDENLVYKGENFYQSIHNQLDEMFVCYPEETTLQSIMPNSKWMRIDYDKNEYYVVGLIKAKEDVKYICYGIPSKYTIKPPKEVQNIAEWLPLDINKPRDVGYWIIYQDGKTGKTLQKI